MTPAARVAAAIEILDDIIAGEPAEKVLTTWGRQHRFAGSKDRAAIRDHVFDALRRLQSSAARGGAMTGRGVMVGLLRGDGIAPETLFTGEGHAPAPLTPSETAAMAEPEGPAALDCPDWLAPDLRASLGADFAPVMRLLQHRAPVFLRVNLLRGDVESARAALDADGIETRPHALSPTALEVMAGARKVARSRAYLDGLVELQDAASQAVADFVPPGDSVLDYCAGGGGKALALAARFRCEIIAHDANPARMRDLPARAGRAGARILCRGPEEIAGSRFRVVLADVPCSGSGAWRRAPESKWRLTRGALDALLATQAGILDRAAELVAPGGTLCYATCSLLDAENGQQVRAFLDRGGWTLLGERRLTPLEGGDGLYVATMARPG